jgi:membrane-associated phospholipid phosphatase
MSDLPEGAEARPSITVVAGSTAAKAWALVKASVLALALFLLLLPDSRLGHHAYLILLGVPLIVAALGNRQDRVFFAWAIYALSFVTFVIVRTFADDLGLPTQYSYVIVLDEILGFGQIATIRLQHWFYTPGRASPLDWALIVVHLSYYAIPPLAGVLLWRIDARRFIRYAVALGITYLLGAVIHVLVPTAPPWYAAMEGLIPPVHRVLYDVLHALSPSFYNYGYKVAAGNEVAAMPSIHFAATLLIGLALNPIATWRRAGWFYAGLMALSLIYLGEHYVIDVIAGAGLGFISWHWSTRVREATGR